MACTGIRKTALSLAVAGAFAGGASQAHASAFALIEQNAAGLGNSYAGAAEAAEDASTIFYNPAGMSLLPAGMQVSGGLALINLSAKFSDSGSAVARGGNNGGDAGSLSAVPNFYFVTDIARNLKVGVGVSVPFGLKTEYDPGWLGRFQAIKSDIKTLNINPSGSYKINEMISVGFGLSYQRIDAELTNKVLNPTAIEPLATVKASDNSWGYNLGAMFQLAPETRLGVSYRSSIKYHLKGTVARQQSPVAVVWRSIQTVEGRYARLRVRASVYQGRAYQPKSWCRQSADWYIQGLGRHSRRAIRLPFLRFVDTERQFG